MGWDIAASDKPEVKPHQNRMGHQFFMNSCGVSFTSANLDVLTCLRRQETLAPLESNCGISIILVAGNYYAVYASFYFKNKACIAHKHSKLQNTMASCELDALFTIALSHGDVHNIAVPLQRACSWRA